MGRTCIFKKNTQCQKILLFRDKSLGVYKKLWYNLHGQYSLAFFKLSVLNQHNDRYVHCHAGIFRKSETTKRKMLCVATKNCAITRL